MSTVHADSAMPPEAFPERFPPVPDGSVHDDNGADEALCARYEAEEALRAGGETSQGCDWPEGALSPNGCIW